MPPLGTPCWAVEGEGLANVLCICCQERGRYHSVEESLIENARATPQISNYRIWQVNGQSTRRPWPPKYNPESEEECRTTAARKGEFIVVH